MVLCYQVASVRWRCPSGKAWGCPVLPMTGRQVWLIWGLGIHKPIWLPPPPGSFVCPVNHVTGFPSHLSLSQIPHDNSQQFHHPGPCPLWPHPAFGHADAGGPRHTPASGPLLMLFPQLKMLLLERNAWQVLTQVSLIFFKLKCFSHSLTLHTRRDPKKPRNYL